MPEFHFEMPDMGEIEAELELDSDSGRSLRRPARSAVRPEGHPSHAVVIGGSMAGLLAGRVLAEHFDRVTVVDRDRLPAQAEFRHGVPQSRHLHALLRRGLLILEELFPGFESELLSAGAVRVRFIDVLRMSPAGWAKRFDGPAALSATRELIEWCVRARTMQLPNLTVLQEHDVVGLISSPDGRSVAGVHLRRRDSHRPDLETSSLHADLVIDASGRNSKAPEWLHALGYPTPRETTIDSFLGYATCVFDVNPTVQADWKVLMISDKPPAMPRAGALFPIEGNRWMVTLAGYGRDYPPTDMAGFMNFASSLRSDALYQAIKNAQPVSRVVGFRTTVNRRRHFEALARRPERFAVVGDAACAFNPVYGQGMSVAAMNAIALRDNLSRRLRHGGRLELSGFAREFQRQVAKASQGAWVIATGADVRYPTTEGHRPTAIERTIQRYLDRVIEVSNHDEAVSAAFFRVVHLIDLPVALFRPTVAFRTLVGSRRQAAAQPTKQSDALPEAVGA